MKRKICFLVQRYGLEVNGGAELLCRQLAEQLADIYDVHVLTSKAIDYMTWKDEYLQENEVINDVTVHRFSVAHERCQETFDAINGRFMQGCLMQDEEAKWVDEQGPSLPGMLDYIKDNKDEYDVFVFFTYLYYQTVMGVPLVQDKAIVVPFAHDEPFLRMKIYDQVFKAPRAFLFSTDEERQLIRQKYHNYYIPYKIGGAGVDVPTDVSAERFKKKYNLDNYILYIGRIDEGKNCDEMFDYFRKYKDEHGGDLKLVLMGKSVIDVPKCEDVVELGFVSEEDKFDGLAGSKFLILPSKFESLSIVVLEAFSLNIPVLVNGECEVLRAHIEKSNGGYFYNGYRNFESCMLRLLNFDDMRIEMGINGNRYVHENYRWALIKRKLSDLIEEVAE